MTAEEFCETEFSGEDKQLCKRYPSFIRELGIATLSIMNNAAIDDVSPLIELAQKSLTYAKAVLQAEQQHGMEQKSNA